ncbi:MAG: hypothetical protein SVX28_03555 [Pseudomonadota bacterium]|nr:hypothetical protein [Pseudomonadota bacterium]
MSTVHHREEQEQTEEPQFSTGPASVTKAERIQALDAAYAFAVEAMFEDGDTDREEIAGVAADYALGLWQDWLPDSGATSGQQVSLLEDYTSTRDWDCTPHIPTSTYLH